jgi:predicted membrane-bound spermidine synthase
MKRTLFLTVFFSGLATLGIELSAERLIGSVFGTSNLVWASIIGLILIYLSLGYALGGRWADRSPKFETMYAILGWGGFLSGLVPLVSRPVLRLAADAFDQLQLGVLFGSFSAILILLSIPVTLLGMISPFAIRLAVKETRKTGRTAGDIYAVSTLGSFIGTFLPGLVLIPLVGTTRTFMFFSGLILVVMLLGLWRTSGIRSLVRFLWMPLVLLVLFFIFARGPIKQTPGLFFETESSYNYIQVLEVEGYRLLRLNEGQGIHSVWHPTIQDYHGTWEQFLAAPFFNAPPYTPDQVESIAVVGLAAGTSALQATHVFGPVPIDGYEIDPAIIEVGREFFQMNQPNLNALALDGRWGLERSQRRYTVIGVDAYRPPYIPWHLTTQEFFQIVHQRLAEDGVMVINVGRSPNDRRLVEALTGTIQTVFPSVFVMDVPDTFNSIIYASVKPVTIENLYRNYDLLSQQPDTPTLLLESIQRVILNQRPSTTNGLVFTDDWAPIEWITNSMVLSFVISSGTQALP